jgi:secreted trypsin-like serine protease
VHHQLISRTRVALIVGVLVCAAWVAGVARPASPLVGRGEPSRVSFRAPGPARTGGARRVLAKASIVGGAAASIAEYPFQVALYDPHAGSPAAGFFCGGVIIDATHVATAAHCVVSGNGGPATAPGDIAVLAGSTSLSSIAPGSVEDPVQTSTYDRRYNPITSDYDVALLTLARPLWSGSAPAANGSNQIAPVAIASAAQLARAEPGSGQMATVAASGWGDVNPSPSAAPGYPTSLRAVRMPLVPESTCEEAYAAIEQTITSRMICAGGGRTHLDTCYGDSGGPLLLDRDNPAKPPGDYVLVGLVDFGNGCAQRNFPGVYTNVAASEIAYFLQSGAGHRAVAAIRQSKHRRHKRHKRHKRHRHRPRGAAGGS